MLKADRMECYAFLEFMDQLNILKESESIPNFVFEYFAQQDTKLLHDVVTCVSEANDSDDLGIISLLIDMFRVRRSIDFMDDKQVNEISLCFSKKEAW